MTSDDSKLFRDVRTKRDLLRSSDQFGDMELRTQWECLESKWRELIDRTVAFGVLSQTVLAQPSQQQFHCEISKAASELEEIGRDLANELKKGYEKLEAAINDPRDSASEPCLEREALPGLADGQPQA